jgi:AraC-like DNA-binding protein
VTVRRVPLAELVQNPVGAWTYAEPLFLWAASPSICGISYSGHVGAHHFPLLQQLAPLAFHPSLQRPYFALIDGQRLTGLDPLVFKFLTQYLGTIAKAGRALIERLVIVRPTGLTGAAVLGLFHQHFVGELDVRFVDTLAEGIQELPASPACSEIERAATEAMGTPVVLDVLRRVLQVDPNTSLDAIARRLGMSTRSLQRECMASGSSFRQEVANARLELATHLLRTSDDKVVAIARTAGYSSAVSLSRRFQKVHGMTPAEFRQRHRR